MSILDSVERGVLFTLTRLVTLVIILAFCVPLVMGGIIYLHFFGGGSHVSYDDIYDELHPQSSHPYPKAVASTESAQAAPPSIPESLKPYFATAEAQQDWNRHLEQLSAKDQREYVDNLSQVVRSAGSGEDIPQVIQQYFLDKDRRIGRTPPDAAILWGSRIGLGLFTVLTMILVALASLILVLLAIERNTRQPRVIYTTGVAPNA